MQLLVATNIITITSCSTALIGFRIKIFRFVFVCCLLSAIIRYTATVKFSCFQVLIAIFAESLVFWVITLCRIICLFGRVVQMGSGPESVSPFLQMDVVCVLETSGQIYYPEGRFGCFCSIAPIGVITRMNPYFGLAVPCAVAAGFIAWNYLSV